MEEYSKLNGSDGDGEVFVRAGLDDGFKRAPTVERARVGEKKGGEEGTTNFHRSSNVRKSISRPTKKGGNK